MPTPLSHLIAEYQAGVTRVDDDHIREFLEVLLHTVRVMGHRWEFVDGLMPEEEGDWSIEFGYVLVSADYRALAAEHARITQAESNPSEDDLVRLQQRFADPTTPDNERVRAIRTLRRSNKLTDDAVVQTLGMLQTSTNAGVRRELLQSLEGSTNAALKQPLLAMLDTETGDNSTREQVVNMLRRFADDPAVEAKLWDLALNDPNTRVRDQARDALSRAPATPERVEQLLNRASNPDASLEERLVSFRALRLAKSQTPELVADLGTLAQNTTDPIARAKLFKSFNGLTDPSLMAPLVNGLQDTDPVVRQNAANALSEFPDPRVQQWLTHLIQNDTDPVVKREAHAALERTQRLNHKPQ